MKQGSGSYLQQPHALHLNVAVSTGFSIDTADNLRGANAAPEAFRSWNRKQTAL